MSDRRPDFAEYVRTYGLTPQKSDPLYDLELLGRSLGKKVTDRFRVYQYPEPDSEGKFSVVPPVILCETEKMNPGGDFILKTDKKLKTVYGFNKHSKSHVFTIPDFYSEGFLIEYLEKEPDIQCTMV